MFYALLIVSAYFVLSFRFLLVSVHSSRFCRLSTRALGQNGRCRQTFSIIRSSLSLHSFSPVRSLRCLPVRTPSLDPSLSFLSRSPTSNCSLICCDRSSCHHLPTGHQRPRTSLRVWISTADNSLTIQEKGHRLSSLLFCSCVVLLEYFSGHLLLLVLLLFFPIAIGSTVISTSNSVLLAPFRSFSRVRIWATALAVAAAVLHSLISNP